MGRRLCVAAATALVPPTKATISRLRFSLTHFNPTTVAHYGLGRYKEAEEEYLKARSIDSRLPPEIHVRLANVYTQLGAYAKAYTELQANLQADPKGRFASSVTAVMRRMETEGVVPASQARSAQTPPRKN